MKNHFKNELNMGRHLGIDFYSILTDFGAQVGTKLGTNIDKKPIQKSIEKQMLILSTSSRVLGASWRVLSARRTPNPPAASAADPA